MTYGGDVTAVQWSGPAPMSAGSPDPFLLRDGNTLWVAYVAHDFDFPGYDHPSAADYVWAHPDECFGVLRFEGVTEAVLGPPSDERLHEHPLYGRGLAQYEFHRLRTPASFLNRWIVTFHDNTLAVTAADAAAFPMRSAKTAAAAIAAVREENFF